VKVRHLWNCSKEKEERGQDCGRHERTRGLKGYERRRRDQSAIALAQVQQRICKEGRQDENGEVYLRNQLGSPGSRQWTCTTEELPGAAEQEGANLIARRRENTRLMARNRDVRARKLRRRERNRDYWRTSVVRYRCAGKLISK